MKSRTLAHGVTVALIPSTIEVWGFCKYSLRVNTSNVSIFWASMDTSFCPAFFLLFCYPACHDSFCDLLQKFLKNWINNWFLEFNHTIWFKKIVFYFILECNDPWDQEMRSSCTSLGWKVSKTEDITRSCSCFNKSVLPQFPLLVILKNNLCCNHSIFIGFLKVI